MKFKRIKKKYQCLIMQFPQFIICISKDIKVYIKHICDINVFLITKLTTKLTL